MSAVNNSLLPPLRPGRGRPTGAREDVNKLLAEHVPGYHPLVYLAQVANDPETRVDLRVRCSETLAKYTHPQLKSVETNVNVKSQVTFNVSWEQPDEPTVIEHESPPEPQRRKLI